MFHVLVCWATVVTVLGTQWPFRKFRLSFLVAYCLIFIVYEASFHSANGRLSIDCSCPPSYLLLK